KGFGVARAAYGMPTAFKAVIGSGMPTVAILCEYDALPDIGHGCGHNLIAIAGVAAGLGVKACLGPGQGTLVVIGTPAEEGGGGKILALEGGAFEGVDVAMMVHPAPGSSAYAKTLAMEPLRVEYRGKAAHASVAPWDGVNALDALVAAFASIGLMRQQMPP